MTKKKPKPEPTAEQLCALKLYAAENGPVWKSKLAIDWLYSRARVKGEHSPLLQQLRNQLGPSWLVNFQLPS